MYMQAHGSKLEKLSFLFQWKNKTYLFQYNQIKKILFLPRAISGYQNLIWLLKVLLQWNCFFWETCSMHIVNTRTIVCRHSRSLEISTQLLMKTWLLVVNRNGWHILFLGKYVNTVLLYSTHHWLKSYSENVDKVHYIIRPANIIPTLIKIFEMGR